MRRSTWKYLCLLCLLTLCSSGYVLSQTPEVCTIDGDSITLRISRAWSAGERAKYLDPFGLDAKFVTKALALSESDTLSDAEGFVWQVTLPEKGMLILRRSMIQEADEALSIDHLINPDVGPQEFFIGPGYVDQSKVTYGRNKFKGPEPRQNESGEVVFILDDFKDANEVVLSGSFNNWRTTELYMKQNEKGVWQLSLPLNPGKYLYKFIVDGYWKHDPRNELKEHDGWNGYNSVRYVYNKRFFLPGHSKARNVVLTGSFNDWHVKELSMRRTTDGWATEIYLNDGSHAYKFLVDGDYFIDPLNPDKRPDGYGDFNSFLSLGEAYRFYFPGFAEAEQVVLSGTFNDWNEIELPMQQTNSGWELYYVLAEGNYEYKFIVDGAWHEDVFNPYSIDHGYYRNSFVSIGTNHLFVTKSFQDAQEVLVTGNFTGWSEVNNRMVRQNGAWVFPMHLNPGKYLYRFKVDGVWYSDETNPLREDNGFGSYNSVIWVQPGK